MEEMDTLGWAQDGAVATVTLHRPKALNAINKAMMCELSEVFRRLGAEAGVRAVVLTGAGERAFAAGADIRELMGLDAAGGRAFAEEGQRVFTAIEQLGKPVIGCLNGLTLGGGLELALACSFRVASETAQLGLPEAKLGLVPGFGGLFRLSRLAGRSAAMKMLLTAQPVRAEEALRLGLVDEVVPAVQLMERGRELAGLVAGLAPLAVAAVLDLDRREEGLTGLAAFAVEAEVFGKLCATADQREGVAAFLEKRGATWRGE